MSWGSRAEWAAVVVALAAGVASLYIGHLTNEDTKRRLDAQEDRLNRQEERAIRQEEEKFAAHVELGEVPQHAYRDGGLHSVMPPREEGIWWAVINANPIRVIDVWVESADGQFIWIDEVQRCTYYVLEPDSREFEPTTVYFKDPWNEWHRSDGQLIRGYENPPGEGGTVHDDGRSHPDPLEDCLD